MAYDRNSLNGWYKRVYGTKQMPLSVSAVLQRLIPFQQKGKTGDLFSEVVVVQRSHGVTMSSTGRGTAYNLNAVRSIVTKEAQISSAEITMREQVAYGALASSGSTDGNGEVSYGNIAKECVLGMEESGQFYAETNFLYGRTSIAQISAISGSSTTRTLTISVGSYAPGLWVNAENALIDIMSAPGGTKRNALADVTVTSLTDIDNRLILVTGNATDLGNVVVGDVIVWKQADAESCVGMDKICTNTGVLFNIDAGTYSAWRANSVSAGGSQLTTGICHQAMTKCGVRGRMGDMSFIMNPLVLMDMLDDTAQLRRYADDNKKELVAGTNSVKFLGTTGNITFESHPMVKCGEAFGIKPKDWMRGGDSDLVRKLPGANNEDFFHEVPGVSAYEMRNFQSQYIFCHQPSGAVKITNIVPRVYS